MATRGLRIRLVTPAAVHDRWENRPAHLPLPMLALPAVAACTPPQHEVGIVDERLERIDSGTAPDVVGITVDTTLAPRAYELARRFREAGSFVVLGGPHVSTLPEEGLRHADAVVVGDAEDTWPRLLEDLAADRARRLYQSAYPDLAGLQPARLDLLPQGAYPALDVTHATRGCPNRCEFCCVPRVGGRRYRRRPVPEVIHEIERHQGLMTLFWDDNLTADPVYARQLFAALAPLGRRWLGQAAVPFACDRDLVRAAAASGCVGLFLGVESFSAETLRDAGKGFNRIERYREAVSNLHDHGIAIDAGIIFGFDRDDPGVFARTLAAVEELRFDVANFNLLTPYPGTPLFDRYGAEGRLLTEDWSRFQPYLDVVFQPAQMTRDELLRGFRETWRRYYRTGPILSRIWAAPWNLGAKHLAWVMNHHFKRFMKSIEGR
jgi:radical SAM superfamily enzyme YgiQ (UPF0313 family)